MHKEQLPTLQLLLGFWRRQPYRYQMISKRTDTSRNINYCTKIYLLTDSLLRPYGDCPDRLWGDCSLIPVDKFLHWFQKESWKGILLGMITWLMVQLNWKKNEDTGIRWQYCLKSNDIAQSGTELRTRVIGEGGREEGALTHLERNGTPVVYLPGLKCCISFNCCKHTFFINKSLNQKDDSVSS